jgi:hypothetical protein
MKNPIKEFIRKRRQAKFEKVCYELKQTMDDLLETTQKCALTCKALNGQVERVNSYLDD